MFVSWTDMERRQMALEVAAGRLDYRIARALLDVYLEVSSEEWRDPHENENSVWARYEAVCCILNIPQVLFIRQNDILPDGRNLAYGVNFRAPFELTETAWSHLHQIARSMSGIETRWFGLKLYAFTSKEHSRKYLRELLHVLSSTVFRKAG